MKINRSNMTMRVLIAWALLIVSVGCQDNFSSSDFNSELNAPGEDSPEIQNPPTDLQICSKLDFSEIVWPENFHVGLQNSFALALNITGSFEGSQSWATIAGDSDDQGLSLGLLQQNLGSGTLQPLMARMKKNHLTKMKSYFTNAHWLSLSAMLDEWVQVHPAFSLTTESLFAHGQDGSSPLDENYSSINSIQAFATPAVTKTLTWARQNILNGKTVKSDWKKEFQTLASSTEYRNFQFKEALTLHNKTEGYRDFFGFETLTAYLFLFDVVVQNGGFNESHRSQYQTYLNQNPNASEITRLKKLLEIRLKTVRERYRNDVNSRKSTIINGTGVVHGSQRDLPKEYCFQGAIQIDPL